MKRLLFFPGYRMLAYEWAAGAYRRVEAFEPSEEGLAAFRAWLAEAPHTPVHLLIDVIEEEFHLDRVPHVIGRERGELYRRTLRKHFRSTELRSIQRQGRDASGRRDDRVLVAGLTNPQILEPWLEPIDAMGIALKGIYSLPLVGEYLLPHLGAARSSDVLVISHQVASTLRQSFYQNGHLRFSRLVPGRYQDTGEHLTFLQEELARTVHFLDTQRLRRGDDPIQVYILAPEAEQSRLTSQLRAIAGTTIHVVALERLARAVGMRGNLPGPHADTLFGHLLLSRQWPRNHYGGVRLRRNYLLQRTRNALWGVAAVLVVVACAVAGGAWLQGRAYQTGAHEAEARTERFERLYEERLSGLDRFDYPAADVKKAVDTVSTLAVALPQNPEPVMARVGAVVADHDRIEPVMLQFQAITSADGSVQTGQALASATAPLARRALADGRVTYHGVLRGRIVDFGGDYRRAKRTFEAFVDSLEAAPALTRISVARAPFDLDPDAGVSGNSAGEGAAERERATFAIEFHHGGGDARP